MHACHEMVKETVYHIYTYKQNKSRLFREEKRNEQKHKISGKFNKVH